MYFTSRYSAGRQLGETLASKGEKDADLVLGLARGGVPIAHEIARVLGIPFDVLIVRKLGTPGHEELAMGAIGPMGEVLLNETVINGYRVDQTQLDAAIKRETEELKRRLLHYRGSDAPLDLKKKKVIIADDGLATGASMKIACRTVMQSGVSGVTVAVPVAPIDTAREISALVDDVVCLYLPVEFWGVGRWYQDFSQTTDDEVKRLLRDQPTNINAVS